MKIISQFAAIGLTASLIFCFTQTASGQWTGTNSNSIIYPTNTNAKVGIGLTNPSTQLHLKSPTVNPFRMESSQDFNYMSYYTAGTYRGYSGLMGSPYDMEFGTSNANPNGKIQLSIRFFPKLTIDTAGNVGIGTTSPQTRLHVKTPLGNPFRLESGTNYTKMEFYTSTGSKAFAGASDSDMEIGTVGGTGGKTHLVTNYVRRMTVDNSGKVGIGTQTPATTFHIKSGNSNPFRLESTNTTNWMSFWVSNAEKGYAGVRYGLSDMDFGTSSSNTYGSVHLMTKGLPRLNISANGNVGIGTTSDLYTLSVNGTIRAKEVRVETGWADYVFNENFRLRPLSEVEQFIKDNKHLPDVTPASEIQKEGLLVAKQMTEMMQKVEELTLYIIQLDKENAALRARVEALEATHK